MTRPINCYCLDWHIKKSEAVRDRLVNPLKPYIDIQLVPWDGKNLETAGNGQETSPSPMLFTQNLPPQHLLEDSSAHLVWMPMWDQAKNYPQEWWNALPRTLRVIAFSNAAAQRAEAAGLSTLRMRYFKNPQDFPAAQWKQGRVALYWNRTGVFSAGLLARLCRDLHLQEMIFLPRPDPQVFPEANYQLPKQIGRTKVRTYTEFFSSRQEYFNLLRQANIYLAPRVFEGVGMTFLEAMASGCAVLAYDAPTMNEYIHSGENGYLLKPAPPEKKVVHSSLWKRGLYRLFPSLRPKPVPKVFPHPLDEFVDLEGLMGLNLRKLGDTARRQSAEGYAVWEEQLEKYARFILDW
jgi:glycosyltransferase involved in cell wall biosynthesis